MRNTEIYVEDGRRVIEFPDGTAFWIRNDVLEYRDGRDRRWHPFPFFDVGMVPGDPISGPERAHLTRMFGAFLMNEAGSVGIPVPAGRK